MYVGKNVPRVDARDKVLGRTKYTDDLCDKSAYIARVLHSTIAHGRVVSVDTSEAEKIPGVVKMRRASLRRSPTRGRMRLTATALRRRGRVHFRSYTRVII